MALLDEASLGLQSAPSADGPWSPAADATVDTARNRVTGTVSTVGHFALTGRPAAGAPGIQDIIDALLGRRIPDPSLDINRDGELAVSDLVRIVALLGSP